MSENHSGADELDGATEDDFLHPSVKARHAMRDRHGMFTRRIGRDYGKARAALKFRIMKNGDSCSYNRAAKTGVNPAGPIADELRKYV